MEKYVSVKVLGGGGAETVDRKAAGGRGGRRGEDAIDKGRLTAGFLSCLATQ